ncbi:MAG: hypothetical protein LAE24_11100 [Candidatus Contendobacter sp.]|nr:hypothetical protein [Candidatus Contendobacter sp.]
MKRKTGQPRPGRKTEPPPRNRKKHGAMGGTKHPARNPPTARKRRGQTEPRKKEKEGYSSRCSRKEKKGKKRKARLGVIVLFPLSKSLYSAATFDRGNKTIFTSRLFSFPFLFGSKLLGNNLGLAGFLSGQSQIILFRALFFLLNPPLTLTLTFVLARRVFIARRCPFYFLLNFL